MCNSRNPTLLRQDKGVAKKDVQTSYFLVLYWRPFDTICFMIRIQGDNRLQVRACKSLGRPKSIPVPTVLMKTIQSVHFPLEVVTTISREPNSAELHRLDAFERHVRRCDDCVIASNSPKFSEVLCSRGRCLAENMLAWVIGASDGHTYSAVACRTRYIRVEIPRKMAYTRRLYRNDRCKRSLRLGKNPRNSAFSKKSQAEAVRRRFTVVYRTRMAS
jgi:hypothetical protein